MTELQQRVVTGLIAAPLFLGALYLGGYAFAAVVALIALGAQHEYYGLATSAGAPPLYPLGMAISISLLIILLHPAWWGLPLAVVLVGLVGSPFVCTSENYLQRVATTLFGVVYPAAGLLALVLLRDALVSASIAAFALSAWVVVAVWATDIGAYFAGKQFGRRKLAPTISPNKTWAGALGGIAGALLIGGAYGLVDHTWDLAAIAWPHIIVLSAGIAVTGQCGDLIQSLLKRTANQKDAGGLLPGHGGFFDRFDAMAIAVPVAVLYLHWIVL